MKAISLISFYDSKYSLDEKLFDTYLRYNKCEIKSHEIEGLVKLIEKLIAINTKKSLFDFFFIGYVIPQISKEFDLLRIGQEEVLNIELKTEQSEENILKQLLQNSYYLSFLGKKNKLFTYETSTNRLYSLDSKDCLIEVSIKDLYTSIIKQKVIEIFDIDALFSPSQFLVSPFNNSHKFLAEEYFLTSDQEEHAKKIHKIITNKTDLFIGLKGKAGTGKTLVIYDIAKELLKTKKKVLIIHCGILNSGHNALNDISGWEIISVKNIKSINYRMYDVLIFDESQRMYPHQMEEVKTNIVSHNKICIFSFDANQTLGRDEFNYKNEDFIKEICLNNIFELKGKIRTNVEIDSFIKGLFDSGKINSNYRYEDIYVSYFKELSNAALLLDRLVNENWTFINYTPLSRGQKQPYEDLIFRNLGIDSVHKVIGQEFDKVVVVLDDSFYYLKGTLLFKHKGTQFPYYLPTQMLYQMLTRAKCKIHFLIVNNEEVLERCLKIKK